MPRKPTLSKTALMRKHEQGTLSQEEKLPFLMKVRGLSRKDAERVLAVPPRKTITDTKIHLPLF